MRFPPFSVVYGDLKAGKTLAVLAAYPTSIYIAEPGALAAAESVLGIPEPLAKDLETFDDVTEFALTLKPGQAPGIVVDDASLIADRTVAALKVKFRNDSNSYAVWGALFDKAIRLRDTLRRVGMHCAFTCHAVPAETKNGVRLRGGPAFPGQTRQKFPAAADLLLHVEARGGTGLDDGVAFGWPFVVRTLMDGDWLAGSRYNTPDFSPLNLREILGLAGWKLPRASGLDWQDKVSEVVARNAKLDDADHCRKVFAQARAFAGKFSKNPAHAEWAIADGYDRAVLRAASVQHRTRLFT